MAMLIVTCIALAFIGLLLAGPIFLERRRARLRKQPIPDAWRQILRQRMPYFRSLPADLQLQLKQHIQVFIAEKEFIGCGGLAITDDIKVTIAGQACLLILNRKTDYYPGLKRILVYPDAFIVDKLHNEDDGVLSEQRQVLAGESWSDGQVILSWQDTVQDAAIVDDGRNVVIHEFAHQLDQETGAANGAPVLARRSHYKLWSQVLSQEFERLQQQLGQEQATLIGAYGATNPAEFFAVVSEVFFEQPHKMAEQHPALYQQLSAYYRLNPLSW